MRHPADIGFVDTHAKSHGRHHDQPVVLLKPDLDAATIFRVHPGMIVAGRMFRIAQGLRQYLGLVAGRAIDDARLPAPRPGKTQNLVARLVFDGKRQMDVRAVKAAQKDLGLLAVKQPRDNLGAGFFIRRGGKRRQWHAQSPAQVADPQVIGAKIVAPLRHAMRLVHRDQADANPAQHAKRARRCQPLWRDVQQLQPPCVQCCIDRLGFLIGIARGDRPCLDPRRLERPHLIAHQGNQRRDHHRHPGAAQRGQLKTQRFSTTGRHDRQHIAVGQHRINDLGLTGTIARKAENRRQKRVRVVHGPGSGQREHVVIDHRAQGKHHQQHDQRGKIDASRGGQIPTHP